MHKALPLLLAAAMLLAAPATGQDEPQGEPPDPGCEEDPQQPGCDPACAEPGTGCDHPPCPTGLAGYPIREDGGVFMSWTLNSFDDINVYRAEGDGRFERIDTLEFPTTRYIDHDAEAGHTYRYQVTAVADDGTESPACGVLEVTAIPVFSTPLAMGLAAGVGAVAYVGLRRRA